MAKVKLDLKKKDYLQLKQFAKNHVDAMDGNAHFPAPEPKPAVFDASVAEYDAHLAALMELESELAMMLTRRDQLRAGMERNLKLRANYVEMVSGGDEAAILSAGFELRSAPTRASSLPAPQELRATMGANPGEIALKCKALANAKSYLCEMRLYDDEGLAGPWQQVKVITICRGIIGGLASGKPHGFRMRALGSRGLVSPWSAEIIRRAP